MYAFLGGLVLTALVAFFIARSVVKSRVARTAETVRLQDESVFNVEKTRLESDLGHANEQVRELLDNLEKAKAETLKQVQAARDEAARANAEVIAARDKAHDEAMEALELTPARGEYVLVLAGRDPGEAEAERIAKGIVWNGGF